VRGHHAQYTAGAGDQRRGLHRTDAGQAIGLEVSRAGYKITRLDIRHYHPLAGEERHAAGAAGINPHRLPERGGRRVESLPRQEPQCIPVRSKHLHARHIRVHDGHGGVENLSIQGIDVTLLEQLGADVLQLLRVGQFHRQPLFALVQGFLARTQCRLRLATYAGHLEVRADAGEQLFRAERFDEVIIRPSLQALDARPFAGARRE